jgi:S1-C subfamily serine protease
LIELRVEHVAGPLTGRARTFGVAALRITLGTDSASDIAFPPGTPGVDAEHAALEREAGRYAIRINPTAECLRNGRPAVDGELLENGDELRLGGINGPVLRIHYTAAGALASRPTRRLQLILGILLLCVALAAWQWDRHRARQSARAMASLLLENSTPLEPPDWAAVLSHVRPSVYAVAAQGNDGSETLLATAWVVAPGLLVTNAHVAEDILEELSQHANVHFVIRSSVAPYAVHRISAVSVHPGYEAFREAWSDYSPRLQNPSGEYSPFDVPGAYDLALLRVAGDVSLEPPLKLADENTLYALRPGDAIAFVGFPAEQLLDVDPSRPNPRIQTGTIVSLTTFTRTAAAPADAQLVEDSLPATGGASGSPIVNSRGEVIAVLNGGNILSDQHGGRMPNAAQVNFAQRIDLVRALLDPAETFNLKAARERWLADLQRYPSAIDEARHELSGRVADWRDGQPPDMILRSVDRAIQGSAEFPSDFPVGQYLVTVLGNPCRALELSLLKKRSKPVGNVRVGHDQHDSCYAAVSYDSAVRQTLNLSVSEGAGERVNGEVHVTIYRRERPASVIPGS